VRVRVVLACALSLACSKHAPLSQACVPGRSVACVGPGGCAGGQVCTPAGDSYGPCVCPQAVLDAGDLAADLAPPTPDVPPVAPDAAPLDLALDRTPGSDLAVVDAPVDLPGSSSWPSCQGLGYQSLADFENRFIVPRCGSTGGCHQSVFPPRNLNMSAMIRAALVGKKSQVYCKDDFYINTTDYTKSFMLAKVMAQGESVTCPSGGSANSGGTRMPNKANEPTVVDQRLSDVEIDCFRWWVVELSRGDGAGNPHLDTCRDVRTCIYQCPDQACVNRCLSWASPAALSLYQKAQTCTLATCPSGAVDCRCAAECRSSGACAQAVSDCDGVLPDAFCDGACH
jgi:hypothetical protein